jgi:hypothetical protein
MIEVRRNGKTKYGETNPDPGNEKEDNNLQRIFKIPD